MVRIRNVERYWRSTRLVQYNYTIKQIILSM